MLQRIGFIGAGQMGLGLARGMVEAELVSPTKLQIHDPFSASRDRFLECLPETVVANSNSELVEQSDLVVLAVKPQVLPAVLQELPQAATPLFVSIVAGASLGTLTAGLGSERVIRVMPNTPCLIGAGASGFSVAPGATPEDSEAVRRILSAIGVAFELPERLLDAVTGLSGSGPAYGYLMVEALSDGGVRMGLPRETATALAAQTLLGAARMVLETGEHPGVLKDRVTSPGGTTIAGLQRLEHKGLRSALIDAVEAAAERAAELGRPQ